MIKKKDDNDYPLLKSKRYNMKIETRIYDDKTLIPYNFLKKYDLNDEDFVLWDENDEGEIIVTFRKKDDK